MSSHPGLANDPAPPSGPSAQFWNAAARGELVVQRCDDCAAHVFTPQSACTSCFGSRLSWVMSTGRGTVDAFTVVHPTVNPADAYVVAIVALEEGWHMLANIVGADLGELSVGSSVVVRFEDRRGRRAPVFAPADSPASRP